MNFNDIYTLYNIFYCANNSEQKIQFMNMHAPSNRSHSLDLALWLQIMDGVVELNELLRESLVGPYGPPRPRKDLI